MNKNLWCAWSASHLHVSSPLRCSRKRWWLMSASSLRGHSTSDCCSTGCEGMRAHTRSLTESWNVQHVRNASVAHLHLWKVLVPTLLHYLLQRFGHFLKIPIKKTRVGLKKSLLHSFMLNESDKHAMIIHLATGKNWGKPCWHKE